MPGIREIRLRNALSQEELAAKAGLSVYTISRLERLKNRPYPRNLRKIAKALHVKPYEIEFEEVKI